MKCKQFYGPNGDDNLNEWFADNPDITVKFCTHSVSVSAGTCPEVNISARVLTILYEENN